MLKDIPCPECGFKYLEDTKTMHEPKSMVILADTPFPEGTARGGISKQNVSVIKCKNCNYVGMYLEQAIAIIIEPKKDHNPYK